MQKSTEGKGLPYFFAQMLMGVNVCEKKHIQILAILIFLRIFAGRIYIFLLNFKNY